MRSAMTGGPAALATSVDAGAATNRDGTMLTNDQAEAVGAAASCDSGWRSRTSVCETAELFASQHVRRACPCEDGGQQHRLRACKRIVGQDSAAATDVAVSEAATNRTKSRRIEQPMYGGHAPHAQQSPPGSEPRRAGRPSAERPSGAHSSRRSRSAARAAGASERRACPAHTPRAHGRCRRRPSRAVEARARLASSCL